jgi:enhancing lycopene biosynthesis protein 2
MVMPGNIGVISEMCMSARRGNRLPPRQRCHALAKERHSPVRIMSNNCICPGVPLALLARAATRIFPNAALRGPTCPSDGIVTWNDEKIVSTNDGLKRCLPHHF